MALDIKTLWAERRKVADERLKICGECPYFLPDSKKCIECGCYMEYKALLPFTNCPVGKWSAYKENKDES